MRDEVRLSIHTVATVYKRCSQGSPRLAFSLVPCEGGVRDESIFSLRNAWTRTLWCVNVVQLSSDVVTEQIHSVCLQ